MSRPITPKDIAARPFPAQVFEAFNHHIAEAHAGGKAVIRQDEVVASMEKLGLKRTEIFERNANGK